MEFRSDLITESRLESAKKKTLTPVRMFADEQSAVFVGSDGSFYTATLESCECMDFILNGFVQPCKHMIRLAAELGVIPDPGIETDIEAARVLYHFGKAKQLIHKGPVADVLTFGRKYYAIKNKTPDIPDDYFEKELDLQTLTDCPAFVIQKNGSVKLEKAYKKDWDNLELLFRNRFGNEVIARINNDRLIEAFSADE